MATNAGPSAGSGSKGESAILRSGTQYIDSESIQKQKDSENALKKKPEEPAGPASIKGQQTREDYQALQQS